jgi:aryl-alcohol dehydrogenase-like predicted oxidoreductase
MKPSIALGCMGLSGAYGKTDDTESIPIGAGDGRAHLPRFSGANGEANARLVTSLQELARRWGITPSQLAIGWVLGRQPQFLPTLGMRRSSSSTRRWSRGR